MSTFLFLQYHCDLTEQDSNIKPEPVAYQEWLEGLSLAKVQLVAEQLLKSMEKFNRIEMDATIRQKLLFLYLQKIKLIYPNLQLELDRPEGLGHEIARRAVSVIVSLYAALFEGLRIASAQRVLKPPLLNREQIKIELLSRTLQAAREVLLTAGRYHVAVPKNVWLYCHSIYQFAQSENLLDKTYKNAPNLYGLYTHMLLIGMIPQSRINEDSFDWLYQRLSSFASKVGILTLDRGFDKPNGFYFDVTVDFAPRFFPRPPTDNPGNWFRVDCQVIVDAFNKDVEEMDNQGKSFEDDAVLMRLIIIEWCYSARRRRPRARVAEPVWFQSRVGPAWELLNSHKDWSPGDILAGGRFVIHPSLMMKVDNNEFGYGVSGDPHGSCIRIGEIALTKTESDSNWDLGVIRWLMINGSDLTISCGLEHITSEASAVEIRPVIGAGNAYFMPALQLPANPKQGKGRSLLLTGRAFSRLREFIVRDSEGNETAVRLSRLTLQTSFYQFAEFLNSEDL